MITLAKTRIYCKTCKQNIPYVLKDSDTPGCEDAFCPACGNRLLEGPVDELKIHKLHEAYREELHLVPLSKIRNLTDRYDITFRGFASILGMEPETYLRYFNGELPTPVHSDLLSKVYEDPAFYLSMLEERKEQLSSPVDYIRSRAAAQKQLNRMEHGPSKAETVSSYLLSERPELTPLGLHQLLYYCDGFYGAFYGKALLPDTCEAWDNGPVYPELFEAYPNYRLDTLIPEGPFDTSVFTPSEKDILNGVLQAFGPFAGKTLGAMIRSEAPWRDARDEHDDEDTYPVISKESMIDFFKGVTKRFSLKDTEDLKRYVEALFCLKLRTCSKSE